MLSLIVRTQTLGWRLKNRLRNEAGQTSSEYLVIAGIVVAVLLVIMIQFRGELTNAMAKLTGRIRQSAQ
jgi:Flp pilus assembly pilin Flp